MAVPPDLYIYDNDDGQIMADKFNRGLGYVDTAGSAVAGDAAAAANSAAQAVAAAGSAQKVALGVSSGLPDIQPTLLLDFTQEGLDPRIAIARPTSRNYWDNLGVLREAPPNVWPREFDPATRECLGRSTWHGRTNIFPNAPAGGLAAYLSKIGTSTAVEEPGVINPFGTTGGVVRVSSDSFSNRLERHFSAVAISNDQAWSSSVFVMPVGQSAVTISVSASDGSSGNNGAEAHEVMPGAWSRISASQPGSGGNSTSRLLRVYGASAAVYLFGLQLESGSSASPYIVTAAVAASRSSELVTMPAGDWYNPLEGTLIVDVSTVNNGPSAFARVAEVAETVTLTGMSIQRHAADVRGFSGDGVQLQLTGKFPGNTRLRIALAAKRNDFAIAANGLDIATDDTGEFGSLSRSQRLNIGSAHSGLSQIDGYIRSIVYYPRRLPNAQLLSLSSL